VISVIIATHNRQVSLRKCLESVYLQTALPDEIVVVDDASNPPLTEDIFLGCPEKIRVKLIRNIESKKASGARNVGIENASGKYIAFLDDDDEYLPRKIERVLHCIVENDFPDVIYHAANVTLIREGISYKTRPKVPSDIFFQEMLVSNIIGGTPMVVCKKEALQMAGGFDENMPALEDYELWLRMAKTGCRFFLLDEILTNYFYITGRCSVSKDIKNNSQARDLIYSKYNSEYAMLSKKEKLKNREAVAIDDLQRFLLNYAYWCSVKSAAKIFFIRPGFNNGLRFFIVLLGVKMSFMARSWT